MNKIFPCVVALFATFFLMLSLIGCVPLKSEDKSKDKDDELVTLDVPAFSPAGGVYKSEQTVTITSNIGEVIYYTTDGATPTTDSTEYTGSFTVNAPTLVRALAVKGTEKRYAMTMYDFDLSTDVSTHLPSPKWTDQIIYFALLDRIDNGNTSNDDQGYSENNVSEETWFSGGDFAGLEARLDYIKNLGVTAIWVTPPIKNQWTEGYSGGSHGYWASDFMEVDPHFGDIAAYKSFVDAAHAKGLYVIQDIVVNHVGDYFNITGSPVEPNASTDTWSLRSDSKPYTAPEQLPWSLNDPSLFTEDERRNNSFYNWTPSISDFNDKSQLYTYQLSNLDDMNTQNEVVQNLLRGYFRFWIDKVDVDGYRVDTVKYVEQDFFEDFVHSTESGNEGIREYAADLGKDDFILFGECWDADEELNASYTQSKSGDKRLDSLIYFTLNFAVRNVFGGGNPTSELTGILNSRESAGYADPKKLVTFIDNHDMTRLINLTTSNLVKEAYAFIMTIPGIPQLYYGVEQGFTETRRAMFKGGYKEIGVANSTDHFDETGEWFTYLKDLSTLRKNNSVFRDGELTVVKDNDFGNGIFAYKLVEGAGGVGKEAFVIFNTSSDSKVAIDVDTSFTEGDEFTLQTPSLGSLQSTVVAGTDGKLTVALPGESFGVYILSSEGNVVVAPTNNIVITSTYDSLVESNSITVEGTLTIAADIRVFLDGNYVSTTSFAAGTTWSTIIDLVAVSSGDHEIVALIDTGDIATYVYSNSVAFSLKKPYVEVASQSDPSDDDTGPVGSSYSLPEDSSFTKQQDITNVRLFASGTDLRVELTMNETTNSWGPTTNDFDHVAFHVFVQKSGSSSSVDAMPMLNSTVPVGMGSWDYYIKLAGWSSGIYESTGAGSDNTGTAVTPTPKATVDHDAKIVTIDIPAASIGSPSDLSGWKIYVSTWDEDSGYPRTLIVDGGQWEYGGADGTTAPLVMDDTAVVTIP